MTAKAQESDKLIGLMAGGDDYLPKPFSYAELLGRVKALLRRYRIYRGKKEEEKDAHLEIAGIRLHKSFNEVQVHGKNVDLSDIEYQILRLLMEYPGRISLLRICTRVCGTSRIFITATALLRFISASCVSK